MGLDSWILANWSMKKIALLIVAELICSFLLAQESYPPLTNVISFYDLQKKSIERKIEWINPDGTHEDMKILEMEIPLNETLKKLTKEFVRSVYGLDSIWLKPKMIVFHAMGDGDLKTSLEVSSFLNDRIPNSWGNLPKAGSLPNGAHFIVDRDGTVICLSAPRSNDGVQVSFTRENHRWFIKRHQDGNPIAMGIENVTDKNNYTNLTEAQLEANSKLARWLVWFENGQVKFLASHDQFNDDKNYDQFLKTFRLQNLQKQFRTKSRKDIGNKNLSLILERVKERGASVQLFFNE